MRKISIEQQIKRLAELLAKKISEGLTLTEAWELSMLNVDLGFSFMSNVDKS